MRLKALQGRSADCPSAVSQVFNLRCNRFTIGAAKAEAAFTLVELILVMALLLIVLAVSAPSLSRFFHGRTLDSEAQRLLSLTRYGQSRAASEGIPMVLWIDLEERSYGLHGDETFETDDPKAVDVALDKDLKIEVPDKNYVQRNLAVIRFLPDGSISDTSPPAVQIKDDKNESMWIVQSLNLLNYEVQNETNQLRQARR